MFFRRRTPITYVPPGYGVDLDRLPPRALGSCRRTLMLLLAGLVVVLLTFFVVLNLLNTPDDDEQMAVESITLIPTSTREATYTPTLVPTIDDWGKTGTALLYTTASPTMDYCWFLTPTPTNTPTLAYTLDAWQREGTAIFYQTNTPTPITSPTPPPPRALCDYVTPTLTPMPLRRGTQTIQWTEPLYEVSPTLAPTRTFTPLSPSNTPLPPLVINTSPPPAAAPQQPINNPPVISPPVVNTVIVIVTAISSPTPIPAEVTDEPTNTLTPTQTPTLTLTPTETHTETPTPTNTFMPTDTATFTPTETQTNAPGITVTDTPIVTLTPIPSETLTITPPPTNTPPPALAIVGASCADRYPSFTITNYGATSNFVQWDISIEIGVVAYGEFVNLPYGAFTNASAPDWIDVPGIYTLTLYQPWDALNPTQIAIVVCE
jgi:hypothetical protein